MSLTELPADGVTESGVDGVTVGCSVYEQPTRVTAERRERTVNSLIFFILNLDYACATGFFYT